MRPFCISPDGRRHVVVAFPRTSVLTDLPSDGTVRIIKLKRIATNLSA